MELFSPSSTLLMTKYVLVSGLSLTFPFGFNHLCGLQRIFIWCSLWLFESWSCSLLRRSVLPSPWPTSQGSRSCLWAQGRPTTTCAASTRALSSALWWRLEWLHVLLFNSKSTKYLRHAVVRCSSPASLRFSPTLSTSHQMKNSCNAPDFILPRTFCNTAREACLSSLNFGPYWEVPQISLFKTVKAHSGDIWAKRTLAKNVIGLLVYKKNPPLGSLLLSFPPFMWIRWRLAGCHISACARGKLSDHSAYLSPDFFTTSAVPRQSKPLLLVWIGLHSWSGCEYQHSPVEMEK